MASRLHLEVERHVGRCAFASVGGQRDRKSHGESSGASRGDDTTRGLIRKSIPVLQNHSPLAQRARFVGLTLNSPLSRIAAESRWQVQQENFIFRPSAFRLFRWPWARVE